MQYVTIKRIHEIEKEIDHDLMAMVRAISEVCEGDAGKYVHLAATSYDTEDTASAMILQQAIEVIRKNLKEWIPPAIQLD